MKYIKILIACTILFISAADGWTAECNVTTVPVNFGSYDTLASFPHDTTGNINITCNSNVTYLVRLDSGINSGNSFSPRRMQLLDGTWTLGYNLFRNTSRTEIWGDGTSNTFIMTGAGSGSTAGLTVYGRIPPGQRVPVGNYVDRVTVTVEW